MFKLVLCALFAVAVAKPDVLIAPYSATYLAPATTTITRQASSVINTHAPLYSAYPYEIAHFIKKRAVPLVSTYVAPTTYLGSSWGYSSYIHDPLLSPLHYSAAHLIKKRSASPQLATYLSTPYASTYYGPAVLPTAYSGLWNSPLVSAYSAPVHFIKKRSAVWAPAPILASAPLASTYIASAPWATSYSSAILPGTPYWSTYAAGLPFIKK